MNHFLQQSLHKTLTYQMILECHRLNLVLERCLGICWILFLKLRFQFKVWMRLVKPESIYECGKYSYRVSKACQVPNVYRDMESPSMW